MALPSSPGLTGQRLFLTCPFVLMYELVNKHNHLLTLGCQRVGQARGGAAFRLPRGYKICGRLGGMGVGSWKLLTSAAVCGRTRRGGGWEPGLEAARKGGASGPRRGLKGGGREGGAAAAAASSSWRTRLWTPCEESYGSSRLRQGVSGVPPRPQSNHKMREGPWACREPGTGSGCALVLPGPLAPGCTLFLFLKGRGTSCT